MIKNEEYDDERRCPSGPKFWGNMSKVRCSKWPRQIIVVTCMKICIFQKSALMWTTLNMSSLLFIIQSKNTSAMKNVAVNLLQSRNFFAFSYVEAAKCGCLGKAIWYQKNKMFYMFMFWTFKITIRLWASLYMTSDKKILNLYMCHAICLLVCFYLSVTFCLLCYVHVF